MNKQNNIIALRHLLHQNAEPSNFEHRTKQILINFLKVHSNLQIVDRGAWFYAYYHCAANRPNIAFRADFDAVKIDETIALDYASKTAGVAHKCGHDGHSATLVNLALTVERRKPDKNVYFIFQHAEETGDGAKLCASLLREKNIAEIYAYHNMSGIELNAVQLIDGTTHFASSGLSLTLSGATCHASQPELGKNPALAIAEIVRRIEQLNNQKMAGTCFATIVQIDVGEAAYGIAAGKGNIKLTVRARYDADFKYYIEQIIDFAKAICQQHALTLEHCFCDSFPATVNHAEQVEKIRRAARKHHLKVIEMTAPYRTSEDFGHYTQIAAGAIFYVGNGKTYPHIHTAQYDFNDAIIDTATEVMFSLI